MMPTKSFPETLIICLGNPLRGDDGVGWHVADALTGHGLPPTATLRAMHQLLPEVAEEVSRAAQVIFVDAGLELPAGEVIVSAVPRSTHDLSRGTHELDPPGLLALAGRLFGYAPPATLVVIGGQSFDHSETLSAAVTSAVPTAVLCVLALLEATPAAVQQ